MKKRFFLLLFLLFTCSAWPLDVIVLGSDGEPLPGSILTFAGEAITAPAPPGTATVDQRNRRFVPHVSLVARGASVSFPNSDDTRHHVYSFSEGNAFELKLYRSNDAPPITFEAPGVVTLGCNIHDNMKAYIVVSDGRPSVAVDDDGRASMPWLSAGEVLSLEVWHPQLDETHAVEFAAQDTATGSVTLTLPVAWKDAQEVRSVSELESMLKRYSRDGG